MSDGKISQKMCGKNLACPKPVCSIRWRKRKLPKEAMAMVTVFIEYKLDEQKRSDFFKRMSSMQEEIEKRGGRQYRCLEGVEQPHLIVEAFEVETMESYEAIKKWRLADQAFSQCIIGGAAKLHIWAFAPLTID
jgi:hypothetical protein